MLSTSLHSYLLETKEMQWKDADTSKSNSFRFETTKLFNHVSSCLEKVYRHDHNVIELSSWLWFEHTSYAYSVFLTRFIQIQI